MNIKIAVIIGSIRPNRVGDKIANWFMNQVKDIEGVEFSLIDLSSENLPFLNEPDLPANGNYQQPSTKKWAEKILQYDGFVFVVPEYNHGYAPALKNAVDTLYKEWAKKPVAFIGYGSLGGVRAVEQLVQVTTQINMVPLPSTQINIIDIWSAVNEDGDLNTNNIRGTTEKLLDNLLWWAKMLKEARNTENSNKVLA